ncbi:unnamed protein product [Microthlaspi erraticum]|uniref:Uncharacterized protein n=1 Tax=Microthlaspi erraticum TaxID=1685480 RepID=A0A6D2KTK7_9BRAS|nr:unnamed protein product [Microthlaspi erraticum]
MKSGAAFTFQVIISYLLLAITTSVAGENEAVLDFYGKPVKANVPYYAGFVSTPAFLTRYGLDEPGSCPEGVVFSFDSNLVPPRIPIIFVSSSSSDVIRVSTEVSIKFALPSECDESGVWRVTDYAEDNDEVLLTGSESTDDSMFTIEKFHKSYKFAFKSVEMGMFKESSHVWRLKLRWLGLKRELDVDDKVMELDVSFFPVMNKTYSAFTS